MSKRGTSNKFGLSRKFCHESFLYRVLRDLGQYTDLADFGPLVSTPAALRSRVSEEVALAELQLSDGGFTHYVIMRQIEALIKKNKDFAPLKAATRRENSLAKFWYAERRCARANRRLKHYSRHWSRAPLAHEILNTAASISHGLLGNFAEWEQDIIAECAFTNGASFAENPSLDLSLAAKLSRDGTVTQLAVPHLLDYLRASPRLAQLFLSQKRAVEIVDGDRVSFVPKNWDVDRVIAVQPSWNVFLQKGVEFALRHKLKTVGIDLRDQSLNHVPAAIGSIDGTYCTVDLSNASDTISTSVVEMFLPADWFCFMDALRAKKFTIDGEWHEYEKFSAMGNAFTFPLETLIFYSICKAVASYHGVESSMLQVYGDDIVVPSVCYPLLCEVLLYAGFEPNRSKSFMFGPFRETCGCDFVNGVDVRPVYMKQAPSSVQDLYGLYNRLLLNKLGLRFPSTLSYLQGLIDRPFYGPGYLLRGDEYARWYAGKSVDFNGYFIGNPPDSRIYDMELYTYYYEYKKVSLRGSKVKGVPRACLYRAFLRGRGERQTCTNKPIVFVSRERVHYWPTMKEVLTLYTVVRTDRVSG